MDILLLLLVIVIIAMLGFMQSRILGRMEALEEQIARIRQQLPESARKSQTPIAPAPQSTPQPSSVSPDPAPASTPQIPKETEPFTPPPAVTQPHVYNHPTETPPSSQQPVSDQSTSRQRATHQPPAPQQSASQRQQAPRPPASPQPGFFERHPDLEKFIGENLVSKIGIAILVLAIGFFVKYAIDNGWIGPVGRICTGLLCGGILVGLAHFLQTNYKAFSSVLVGGGLAVFYFTITLAYHQYHLLGQTAAFIIMLAITSFAVLLSLLYDRQELAIIALVGGFLSPFLASNGEGNFKVLFIYLLILNAGLLVIAYRKSWRLLNILAFGFTSILFASWLFNLPDNEPATTFHSGFLFATIFYLLFFVINILYNIREKKRFIASDFGILLINTCSYFGLGLYMINAMHLTKFEGAFSACMGIFNLGASYLLLRTKNVDTNVLYLLIGITLTFISLTAPIQLHGHYITLFWASESILLYWLARKSGLCIIDISARIVWGAMLVSLIMDWFNVYNDSPTPLTIVFNKGLMTTFYAAACCIGLSRLVSAGRTRHTVLMTGCILFFIGGILEINHQFQYYYPNAPINILYLAGYTFGWIAAVSYIADKKPAFTNMPLSGWLLPAGILIYLLLTHDTYQIQTTLLPTNLKSHFWAHWASDIIIIGIFYRMIAKWRQNKFGQLLPPGIFATLICTTIVIFLSIEVLLLVNSIFYPGIRDFDRIGDIYIRTGLPILWGLASFMYMWLGMRNKFKELRIISLVIFSITLVKLFLYDIRNIPVAGKIAAFFCLGILLLVVSFMYQRLKKIIVEDEENKSV